MSAAQRAETPLYIIRYSRRILREHPAVCAQRSPAGLCSRRSSAFFISTPPGTGEPVFTGGNAAVWRRRQKGTGHRMVSCPLLTPLTFLCADTSEMCSETRGAHSDVWCSKGQRLMEAELFAAERRRPAPSGRALLCAAPHAR